MIDNALGTSEYDVLCTYIESISTLFTPWTPALAPPNLTSNLSKLSNHARLPTHEQATQSLVDLTHMQTLLSLFPNTHPPGPECLEHCLYRLSTRRAQRQGCQRGVLSNAAGPASALALDDGSSLGEVSGSCKVAKPPAWGMEGYIYTYIHTMRFVCSMSTAG